jgi:ribonuclease HII
MARVSARSAVKEKPSKKKRGPDPLSERLAFDIDKFDDFVMGNSDPATFRKEARLSRESFGQLKLFAASQRYIIGVDEVGRGCLAGPVVAAAVVLPGFGKKSQIAERLALLNDSKKLSSTTREHLSKTIQGCARYAIAEASPEEIDSINIFHASLLAMKRAVTTLVSSAMLDLKESLILIDGKWTLPELEANQLPVIKGDTRSAAIAAASVVAKVYRDALMVKLGTDFPHYKWNSNKGYPSEVHRQAIQEHGMTVWHRRSFRCLPEPEAEDD